jgi:EAL domain-containing protein (putative c-di-GMP-specific phosphodiesterase class I)
VRWQHPRRGLIGPERFVPLAEQSGLIQPLSRSVLEAALRQYTLWRSQGLAMPIAVNLSARNLDDAELRTLIGEMLAGVQRRAVRC